jgi:RNA polymerase sigma-70 factor (ECF subfamily)
MRAEAPSLSETARLTRGLAAGEEEAFREFHRRYFNPLFRCLLVLTRGQEHEAEEALQETLCRVAKYARPFVREEVFWCWLMAVARSAARDAGRKRRRYRLLLQHYALRWLPAQPAVADEADDLLAEGLRACLAALPAADRALVEAKYLRARNVRDLAHETGLTEKAVESRLRRLRRLLREQLLRRLRLEDSP